MRLISLKSEKFFLFSHFWCFRSCNILEVLVWNEISASAQKGVTAMVSYLPTLKTLDQKKKFDTIVSDIGHKAA